MSKNTIRRRAFFFFIPLLGATWILSCNQVDKGMGAFVFRDVVAYAGVDQRLFQYLPINLDGSGSKSPEGQSLTYRWNQIAGPETDIRRAVTFLATVAPSELGEYVFELTVTGSEGGVSTDQVTLSIVPAMGIGPDYFMADALPSSIDPLADLLVVYAVASDLNTHSPAPSSSSACCSATTSCIPCHSSHILHIAYFERSQGSLPSSNSNHSPCWPLSG